MLKREKEIHKQNEQRDTLEQKTRRKDREEKENQTSTRTDQGSQVRDETPKPRADKQYVPGNKTNIRDPLHPRCLDAGAILDHVLDNALSIELNVQIVTAEGATGARRRATTVCM